MMMHTTTTGSSSYNEVILQRRKTMKRSLCLLAFLHGEGASGFVSTHYKSSLFHRHRTSSELHDSLFDDIFESDPNRKQQPPKNYNEDAAPFSELESDQDRARRMEMVRELQKVYYKEPNSAASSSSTAPAAAASSPMQSSTSLNTLSYGHTTLRNLPTITSHDGIQTADSAAILPGYQFVWNIHNPQHCHMFHSILSGPAPWYFAHVFLPGSSSSSATTAVASESSTQDETHPTIDNMESYNGIQSELNSSQGLHGTLLRITDRRFHDEDGRIVLAVQAIEKIRIHNVSSKPGTSPYLCTDVQLAPDDELMRMYFDKALMSSASILSSHDASRNRSGENDENDDNNNPLSSPAAVSGAARAAAVADSLRCRQFECLPIFLEEKPKRPNNIEGALEAKPTDSNATKKVKDALKKQEQEKADAYMSVVQLMNYDKFAYGALRDADSVTTKSLETYWKNLARAQTPSAEEDLFSETEDSSSFFLPEPSSSISSTPSSTSVEAVQMMEYHLWRSLDNMLRLLSMVSSASVPLPSQLMGLLPKRDDWPADFLLEGAATSLENSGGNIGTSFKSPFVRVDQVAASSSKYSTLRRAHRLSYVIWMLLDGLSITGNDQPTRRDVLKMTSVLARLEAAKRTIDGVNDILKQLIPPPKKE
mmetsp:Transcript_21193/g.42582  ORF Transcript_21193/g.42582 Transcript_21193/m.42582 type:complete len:651 (-) Transcript_21193:902-2854(-)